MPDSPMLSAALRYAALGWAVFPCRTGGKEPSVGRGCRAASKDPQQIRKWWTQTPDANIGLACGAESGIYAVDIDVDAAKGINGFDSLAEPLPETVISQTPRGGGHYLFAPGETAPANKNALLPGIDIRGDGYYIILPPSTFKGRPYQWLTGHDPWNVSPARYPDFLLAPVAPTPEPEPETAPEKPRKAPPWGQKAKAPASSVPPSIRDRAVLYLRECEPAMQGFAGHDKLLWAARAMTRGFMIPEAEALSLLQSEYNPRCTPPWNLTNARDAKDFARKVSEAIRTPGTKPEGWLLDEFGLRGADRDRLVKLGDAIADSLLAGPTPAPEPPVAIAKPVPADLLTPPGLVGEICQWINSTALKDQPLLTLGAALTFCGAMMGRKVRDELDNRTNLYVMSVAESSAGKGHARRQIKRLVDAAGIVDLLGGEDVTSDAAIEKRLESQPTTLFLWDEIGHLMQSIKASGSNPHLAKILPTLMKLYSASGEVYIGKEYATADSRVIDQPCCCLYGTTTPDKLADGISPSEIRDGFLGRVLVFLSDRHTRKDRARARKAAEVPDELIDAVRMWWAYRVVDQGSAGNIDEVVKARQMTVPTTPDAEARFIRFDDLAESKAENPEAKGEECLWGKAEENARKIALIVACGDSRDPVICGHHADYACRLVEYLIENLAEMIVENVSESLAEKDKQYILRIIAKSKKTGLTKRDLTRRTRKFESRQRESYLRDLIDGDEIVMRSEGKTVRFFKYPIGLIENETTEEK